MSVQMDREKLNQCAQALFDARVNSVTIPPLTKTFENFTLEAAYEIQKIGIHTRLQAGEKIVGYKMGLTSKAKMEQMGLHTPIYGVLLDQTEHPRQTPFRLKGKIHPKIEPEIAFITSKDLYGKINVSEAFTACSKVLMALEILDSRYHDFKYFTLHDVVADNSSSSGFILGEEIDISRFSIDSLGKISVTLKENGEVREKGESSAVLGNPLQSLCELVSLLAQSDTPLPAHSIVLTGAITPAIALKTGQTITGDFFASEKQLEKMIVHSIGS